MPRVGTASRLWAEVYRQATARSRSIHCDDNAGISRFSLDHTPFQYTQLYSAVTRNDVSNPILVPIHSHRRCVCSEVGKTFTYDHQQALT